MADPTETNNLSFEYTSPATAPSDWFTQHEERKNFFVQFGSNRDSALVDDTSQISNKKKMVYFEEKHRLSFSDFFGIFFECKFCIRNSALFL